MSRASAFVRRLSLGVVDQLLSSGSNFVALLLGARYLDVVEFGSYSLALVSYTLTLGVTRALCSEALLVRPGEGAEVRRNHADAAGAAVWVGLAASVAFALAALFTSGATALCLFVLAVTMPGLLVQDTFRYAAFARGTPRSAVVSDATWFAGLVLGFGGLVMAGAASAPAMLLAWTLPGVLAGWRRVVHEGVMPRVGSGIAWITRNRDLSVRYVLDFITGAGAALVASYVLVVTADVTAVGSIRGAQTIFGPVNILLTGAYIVLVPEGRRAAARSARALTVACVAASVVFAAVAAGLLLVFLSLDGAQGRLLLGGTWDGARTVLVPVGLASVAGGSMAGAIAGLRSLAAARELLRVRLFTIPTTLALPIVGATFWEARGLAYGILISVWWNVGWYWLGYARALRDLPAGGLEGSGGPVAPGPGAPLGGPATGEPADPRLPEEPPRRPPVSRPRPLTPLDPRSSR